MLSLWLCEGRMHTVKAQLQWGVKGGVNLSTAAFNKDVFKSDNRAGFFIGPMIDFKLPILGLGFDGAFMFSQRKFAYDERNNGASGTINHTCFDIPINLQWSIRLGNMLAVYLAAGPIFFFVLTARHRMFSQPPANVGLTLA